MTTKSGENDNLRTIPRKITKKVRHQMLTVIIGDS